MPDEKLSFLKYYWLCFKHFGKRLWTSRGNELLSALVWAAAAFIVSFAFSDAGAFKSFEIAVLVVLAWLTLYAIVHIFKTPWLIHRGENGQTHQCFGFVGIGVAVLIVIELAVLLFHVATRTPEASKQCWLDNHFERPNPHDKNAKSATAAIIRCNYRIEAPYSVSVKFDRDFLEGTINVPGAGGVSVGRQEQRGSSFVVDVDSPSLPASQLFIVLVQGTTEQSPTALETDIHSK